VSKSELYRHARAYGYRWLRDNPPSGGSEDGPTVVAVLLEHLGTLPQSYLHTAAALEDIAVDVTDHVLWVAHTKNLDRAIASVQGRFPD
jgi:hypothetical protein